MEKGIICDISDELLIIVQNENVTVLSFSLEYGMLIMYKPGVCLKGCNFCALNQNLKNVHLEKGK